MSWALITYPATSESARRSVTVISTVRHEPSAKRTRVSIVAVGVGPDAAGSVTTAPSTAGTSSGWTNSHMLPAASARIPKAVEVDGLQ